MVATMGMVHLCLYHSTAVELCIALKTTRPCPSLPHEPTTVPIILTLVATIGMDHLCLYPSNAAELCIAHTTTRPCPSHTRVAYPMSPRRPDNYPQHEWTLARVISAPEAFENSNLCRPRDLSSR